MNDKDSAVEDQEIPILNIKMEVFDLEENSPFVKEEVQGHADGEIELNLGVSKYECNICCDIFASDYSLKEHISEYHHQEKTERQESVRVYRCGHPLCEKTFATKYKLSRHTLVHTNERPFGCEQPGCPKTFKTKDNVEIHMISHKVDRPFKCTFDGCKSKFKSAAVLNGHLRTHSGENQFKCRFPDCGKVFLNKTHLKSHERVHYNEKLFKCIFESCEMTFKWKSNLKIHERVHKLNSKSLELIKCDFPGCSSEFRWKYSYQAHRMRHPIVTQYRCSNHNCVESFSKKEDLEEHLKSHLEEKISSSNNLFKCNRSGCNEMFPDSSHLLAHKRLHCSAETFECKFKECSKKFTTVAKLNKHLCVHDDNAPFKCTHEGCRKAFKRKDHLKGHRRIHDIESNSVELIKCHYPDCKSKFRCERSYQQHIRRHEKGLKNRCTFGNCVASFVTRGELQEHVKSHKEQVNNIKMESHQEDNGESTVEMAMSTDEVLSNIQEAKEESIDTTQPVPQHEYEAKTQQNEFKFEEIGCTNSQDSHQYDEMINVYQCFYCQDTFDEENEFKDHMESCGKYSKIDYLEEGQIKRDDATVDVKSEFENIQ